MIKNIISYLIPFGGLIVLFISFHFLDKYSSSPPEEQLETDKNIE